MLAPSHTCLNVDGKHLFNPIRLPLVRALIPRVEIMVQIGRRAIHRFPAKRDNVGAFLGVAHSSCVAAIGLIAEELPKVV